MQEAMREEALDVNIHFTIKDVKYMHWHILACEQRKLTSAQIVQKVYCKWLNKRFSHEYLKNSGYNLTG